mmetsp:Transcript_33830/g.54312  ORF Transcript_33830/g.54312 Transcript_33830/m.54312 type:complete len:93 (+) Transcript_33830:985-1263(+)
MRFYVRDIGKIGIGLVVQFDRYAHSIYLRCVDTQNIRRNQKVRSKKTSHDARIGLAKLSRSGSSISEWLYPSHLVLISAELILSPVLPLRTS